MTPNAKLMTGRVMLTIIALFTMIAPFLADWNVTHIYNPLWPPHAKFHNAQTMSMGVLLGLAALFFLWGERGVRQNIWPTIVFVSLYWVSQLPAFLFPGVAWTDPDLLKLGQSLTDFPMQLQLDVVLFALIAIAAWLMITATDKTAIDKESRA
jgi:hypothetical protein